MRMCMRRPTRSDKRVLQEVGQSSRGAGPALRVVQLLPEAHHAQRCYSRNGGGVDGSRLDNRGDYLLTFVDVNNEAFKLGYTGVRINML